MGIIINKREMPPLDWAIDISLAGGIFALGCGQLILAGGSFVPVDPEFLEFTGIQRYVFSIFTFVFLALMSLPLMVRRVAPWPVFIFVLGTYLAARYQMGGQEISMLAPSLALLTIAQERGRWEVIAAAIIATVAVLVMATPGMSTAFDMYTRILTLTYFGLALFVGTSLQSYRRYKQESEQRLAEADLLREQEAARRVEEERVRIARELHDITAHSLSAVSIQAAAAERLVDRDAELAKESIRNIRDTAKTSLDEIRAMVGVLRGEGEAAERVPTRGAEHLDELVAYLNDAGVEATCEFIGYDTEQVPAYVDVALFGIAREAATNIVKHAEASSATITLHANGSEATLMVVDDGKGSAKEVEQPSPRVSWSQRAGMLASRTAASRTAASRTAASRTAASRTAVASAQAAQAAQEADKVQGHGLQGMAERAHLLGGTFEAYDVDPKGFAVVVTIPYRGTERLGSGNPEHGYTNREPEYERFD